MKTTTPEATGFPLKVTVPVTEAVERPHPGPNTRTAIATAMRGPIKSPEPND